MGIYHATLSFFILLIYSAPTLYSQSGVSSTKKNQKLAIDTATINQITREAKQLILTGQFQEAENHIAKAEALSKTSGYKSGLASCFTLRGTIGYRQGRYLDAVDLLKTALMISQMAKDSVVQSAAWNALGNSYAYMGDHAQAMKCYFRGLEIEEKITIQNNLHWFYSNIANLYSEQNNSAKAFEYAFKALNVERKVNAKGALAVTLSNIAGMFQNKEKYDSSLFYYKLALPIAEEVKDTFAIALNLSNSALVYTKLKQYQAGYDQSIRSLKIAKDKGYQDLITYGLQNLADIDLFYKRYESAEKNYLQGLKIAKKIKSKLLIKEMSLSTALLYKEMGDYKKAYEYYKFFSDAKDSLLNEQNSKLITEMNTKYTTETKEKEIELLKKNENIQSLEFAKQKNALEKQRAVSIGVFVGFILLMIVAILFYSRYRLKKKANDLLQHAYDLIEEKNATIEKSNLMITDSITYAKRIQDAILPAEEDMRDIFSKKFFCPLQTFTNCKRRFLLVFNAAKQNHFYSSRLHRAWGTWSIYVYDRKYLVE